MAINLKLRTLLLCLFTAILLFETEAVRQAVLSAINMCLGAIIPSLFVFFVMSDLIVKNIFGFENSKVSPKWCAFILGAVCGFPVGAFVLEKLYGIGKINKKTASELLPYCNNTSPAFILGAIGKNVLNDPSTAILIYTAQLVASFIMILPKRCETGDFKKTADYVQSESTFFTAIENAIKSSLKITGIICFFSAVLGVIKKLLGETIGIIFATFLEIGNGVFAILEAKNISYVMLLSILAFICGWSGVCVHFQVINTLKSIKVKYLHYAFSKLLQGILTSLLTYLGYKMLFVT